MIYFKWTTDMEIGHAEIDEQHAKLCLLGEAAVEALAKPDEKKLAAAQLQVFIVFSQEHFKYEEGLMRSSAYPEAERHARDHASLLTELIVHCNKVHWGQNTNPAGLSNFLWNWLILHIDLEDRKLVAWLNSHKPDVMDARNDSVHLVSEGRGPADEAAL